MAHVNASVVESFFQRYGWTFHTNTESSWTTGWRGEHRSFPMEITLGENYLTFKVCPLMPIAIDLLDYPELSLTLLSFNSAMSLAKLGLEEGGSNITLRCDIHLEVLTFEELSHVLGVMGHYADEITEEIFIHLDGTNTVPVAQLLS